MLPPEILIKILEEVRGPTYSHSYTSLESVQLEPDVREEEEDRDAWQGYGSNYEDTYEYQHASQNENGDEEEEGDDMETHGKKISSWQNDLASLSLTSKLFNELATPLLYQTLTVDLSSKRCLSVLATLLSRPTVAEFVRRLFIARWTEDECWDYVESAKKVAILLSSTIKVEQVVLCGVNSYIGEDVASAVWTAALRPLENLPLLRSLQVTKGIRPNTLFALPVLASLQSLHVDQCTSSKLCLHFPSLITLSMSEKDMNTDGELEFPPQLQYLNLRHISTPQFVAKALILSPKLKICKAFVVLYHRQSNFLLNLAPVPEAPGPGAESFQITILHIGGPPPSDQCIECIRKLLFDFRQFKHVEVFVQHEWDGKKEGKEFLTRVGQVWQAQGTKVKVVSEE